MNKPLDRETGCWECHRGMYTATDVFDHEWHGSVDGAKLDCVECHTPGLERQKSTAKQCETCHLDLFPAGSPIMVESYLAPSYTDVLHKQCITCHQERALVLPDKPNLALCATCHETMAPEYLHVERDQTGEPAYNRVILPEQSAK